MSLRTGVGKVTCADSWSLGAIRHRAARGTDCGGEGHSSGLTDGPQATDSLLAGDRCATCIYNTRAPSHQAGAVSPRGATKPDHDGRGIRGGCPRTLPSPASAVESRRALGGAFGRQLVCAGLVVVTFAGNLPAQSVPTLGEVITIGRADGPGPYVFGSVEDVALDAKGNLYVLDGLNAEVRAFDHRGRHIGSLGRIGRGPAEFVGRLSDSRGGTGIRPWRLEGSSGRGPCEAVQASQIGGLHEETRVLTGYVSSGSLVTSFDRRSTFITLRLRTPSDQKI